MPIDGDGLAHHCASAMAMLRPQAAFHIDFFAAAFRRVDAAPGMPRQ